MQGIGFAVCRILAEAGTDIAFTHYSPYDQAMPWGVESGEPARIQEQLIALGADCSGFAADLSLPDEAARLFDAAKLVAFLCSIDAAWITGQVLHSHGGFQ